MKGIKSLENVAQVEVKLISPDNLKDYWLTRILFLRHINICRMCISQII